MRARGGKRGRPVRKARLSSCSNKFINRHWSMNGTARYKGRQRRKGSRCKGWVGQLGCAGKAVCAVCGGGRVEAAWEPELGNQCRNRKPCLRYWFVVVARLCRFAIGSPVGASCSLLVSAYAYRKMRETKRVKVGVGACVVVRGVVVCVCGVRVRKPNPRVWWGQCVRVGQRGNPSIRMNAANHRPHAASWGGV